MANIKDILNSIKLAIRSKGVSVADCDSPEVYPEKILQIKRTVSDATDTVCIHAYCSSQNTPSKPTGNPYNFSTGAITYPEGWSNPDNLSGNIWESHIVVTSNTSVQNGIVEDWTKPIKIIASYNLEDILDYDALNEEISQKIAEDYQEVYEDYQTAISELQSDVERYKNKTDTLEGEYENLVIKTTEDLNSVTRDITEQVLNSEGFSTKVTQIVDEDYVTQSTFNQTANSITSRITELDGENGRMSQLEQSVDGIESEVFDSETGASKITQLANSVSTTISNETSAAAIVAKVNESGSEITLNADKINLSAGSTFIDDLINDNAFINNLRVKKLNTVSQEARIAIENGELIVYQYINGNWIKRLSLGFDTFKQKVAIVIYDEYGMAVKDLTDEGLTDRNVNQRDYRIIRNASWSAFGNFKEVPDTTTTTIGYTNYVPDGHVECVCTGSALWQYNARIAEVMVLDSSTQEYVGTGEYVYWDPTISGLDGGHYVSSCTVNNKIFTASTIVEQDWSNYEDYLADGYYREEVTTPCRYREESDSEVLTGMREFEVKTISNGVVTNTRTCAFDTFAQVGYVDRTTNICSEIPSGSTSQWNIVIDHITDSNEQQEVIPVEDEVQAETNQ